MSTLLCIPIMVQDASQALRDCRAAKDAGADLVELRVDEVFHGEGDEAGERLVLRLVTECPLPCIATCRAASEGGHYDGDEPARISLLQRLATADGAGEHPPRYIDVELETLARSANIRQKIAQAVERPGRDLTTSLILSFHDFGGRPADLTRRVLRMQEEPAARVLKVAFRARSLRDNVELFELLARRDRPMIALAMGEYGLMSRVLAPKFGGFLTFASLRPESATAPGQPTVRELLDLYRFRSIGPATAVYGVVGWPLEHSLSPHVHNAGFEAIGADAVYLRLPIPGGLEGTPQATSGGYENLKATLGELIDYPALNLRGVSVTSPHKENLVRLASELGWTLDSAAASIRAANTLVIERHSAGHPTRVRAANTDIPALAAVVRDAIGEVNGRKIAVVGAGGAARAAVFGLVTAGARVTVYSRTPAKSVLLAESARHLGPGAVEAAPLADLEREPCDAVIHCTPVGMAGGPNPRDVAVPIEPFAAMSPVPAIIETVYNPLETPLLKAARARGLRTVDGLGMFVRQAALQFEAWTGSRAPTRLFERVCRDALGAPAS